VSRKLGDKFSLSLTTCLLPLQLPLGPYAVLSAGNATTLMFRAGLQVRTRADSRFRNRQSPLLSRRPPHGSGANSTSSPLAKYVESNCQTASGTSREALHRYFSNTHRPITTSDRNSTDTCIAVHKAHAQAAIDAVDAAMGEEDG
jgi:hypothetical protein